MTDINSWSETDGSNTSAAPAGAPEGMAPSGVNDTIRAIMGSVRRFFSWVNGTLTTSGTNTITGSYSVAPAAYVTGQRYMLKAGGTNTGAATLNINSLGAKDVKTKSGAALGGGEIRNGEYFEVLYDGTNMVLISAPALAEEIIITKTASASAELEFTLPSGYDLVSFWGRDLLPATQDASLRAQVSIAAAYQTAGSYTNTVTDNANGTVAGAQATTDTSIAITGASDDNGTIGIGFTTELLNTPSGTALVKLFHSTSYCISSAATRTMREGFGFWGAATSAIDKVKFFMSSGDIASGVIVMRCRRSS